MHTYIYIYIYIYIHTFAAGPLISGRSASTHISLIDTSSKIVSLSRTTPKSSRSDPGAMARCAAASAERDTIRAPMGFSP